MPTESLILRRAFPVPVTLTDLKRARALIPKSICRIRMQDRLHQPGPFTRLAVSSLLNELRAKWNAALKEATGAIDEVYAVIDGHEVRVAIIYGPDAKTDPEQVRALGPGVRCSEVESLLIKADEQGYWERPHEVVHVLEERPVSRRVVNLACGVSPDKAGA